MSLISYHPAVTCRLAEWQKIMDCVAGEDRVKSRKEKYLPKLNYSKIDPDAQRKYDDYVLRADFPDITGRTVAGLEGMLFPRPPLIDISGPGASMKAGIERDVTGCGMSFLHFAKSIARQLIAPSRVGILVDATRTGDPFQVCYGATDIIKWWERKQPDTGLIEVWRVILRECFWADSGKGDDEIVEKTQYRELVLLDGGPPDGFDEAETKRPYYLVQQLHEADPKNKTTGTRLMGPSIVIFRQKQVLDFIPFIFGNPTSLNPMPETPLMLGIANTNLAIYRNTADLENGRHWTGRPQPYWFGAQRKSGRAPAAPIEYGTSVVWTSENAQANAGFVEFSGDGLGSLERGVATKTLSAREQGARLLEAQPVQMTAAQSKSRDQSEKSTVSTLADTTSEMLSLSTAYQVWWDTPGITLEQAKQQVRVQLNPDKAVAMTPEAAKAWADIQLYGNGISNEELFDLYHRHGVYDDKVTYEQHLKMLAADRAVLAARAAAGDVLPTPTKPPPIAGSPRRTPERTRAEGYDQNNPLPA